MSEETLYAKYLRLRKRWHEIVLEGAEADSALKNHYFDALAQAWRRLDRSEKACAGKHASMVYHWSERWTS